MYFYFHFLFILHNFDALFENSHLRIDKAVLNNVLTNS